MFLSAFVLSCLCVNVSVFLLPLSLTIYHYSCMTSCLSIRLSVRVLPPFSLPFLPDSSYPPSLNPKPYHLSILLLISLSPCTLPFCLFLLSFPICLSPCLTTFSRFLPCLFLPIPSLRRPPPRAHTCMTHSGDLPTPALNTENCYLRPRERRAPFMIFREEAVLRRRACY